MNNKFSFRKWRYSMRIQVGILFSILLFASCQRPQQVSPGKFSYFKSKESAFPSYIDIQEPRPTLIQKNDVLGVMVSSLNVESNDAINFTNINTLPVSIFSGKIGGGGQPIGYVVDSLGYVNIPFVGKLAVEGISLQKAENIVTEELIKKIKAPVVNIRFMNHKFSVLGEVGAVGTFNLLDDKTTILDAIALAGDLSVFAKRDSVIIIRSEHSKREINIVNLNDRSVFLSPYFYLKNNDIIYVEPSERKYVPERPFKQVPPTPQIVQRIPVFVSIASFLILLANFFK